MKVVYEMAVLQFFGMVQGLQRPMYLGYKHTSLMWYLLAIHVKNLSNPKPYPPWRQVPYNWYDHF